MNKDSAFLPLILAGVALIGMLCGMRLQESLQIDGLIKRNKEAQEDVVSEALNHVNAKFYGEYDAESMSDAMITELVDHLDPYSYYFKREASKEYDKFIMGEYEGLGFEYLQIEDSFFVSNVIQGGPAAEAGLETGDLFLQVEGKDLLNPPIKRDSLVTLFRQELGDTVNIRWRPRDGTALKSSEVVVSDVDIPLIHSYYLGDSSIIYVRLDRFYSSVYGDLMNCLEDMSTEGLKIPKLVIDLRGNRGGLLNETVKILNQFITESNKVLASTVDNLGRSTEYKSNGRSFMDFDKTMVLIDKNSASASEILAGALQDYDKALVYGDRSFGKGMIQQNIDLSNDGSLNLTTGEYVLPSGRRITNGEKSDTVMHKTLTYGRPLQSGRGVMPDFVVKDTCEIRQSSLRASIRRFIVNKQAWEFDYYDQSFIDDFRRHMDSEWTDVLKEECMDPIKSKAMWLMARDLYGDGAVMPAEFLDSTLLDMVDILTSNRYQKTLDPS